MGGEQAADKKKKASPFYGITGGCEGATGDTGLAAPRRRKLEYRSTIQEHRGERSQAAEARKGDSAKGILIFFLDDVGSKRN